jgi:hypothetical protein
MKNTKEAICSRFSAIGALAVLATLPSTPTANAQPRTPSELVAAYDSLAATILGAKNTEHNLVKSILAATYDRAEAALGEAKAKIGAGETARPEVERLAALVAQLGNEGDAAVAGIRKRLLEGGHHHNAAGEQQGIYDEGFVIVTRAAKKTFLDTASAIGSIASSPDVGALEEQWGKVRTQYQELMKSDSP